MRLILLSGRSGAGKSFCLHILEDMGFYCVDNLPIILLPSLLHYLKAHHLRVAVSVDARNAPEDLKKFSEILQTIQPDVSSYETIFIDADDKTLLKRFSETRRKHPLTNTKLSLSEALAKETEILEPISSVANLRIDTSGLSLHQFRHLLHERLGNPDKNSFHLLFLSFGYKRGTPPEADFVFDVRCLPNPFWQPELAAFTGRDQAVIDFLEKHPQTKAMLSSIQHFVSEWLPSFQAEKRKYLTIAIGCTGGQHRSVYIAEQLKKYFEEQHGACQIQHRELL